MSEKDSAEEAQKRAIFEAMSERRKKHVLKIGYEKWDPFQKPKDPIDIRTDGSRRTTQMLVREYLETVDQDTYSNAYGQGVLEIALGIVNTDDRFLGMFDFACWYKELLDREGRKRPGHE